MDNEQMVEGGSQLPEEKPRDITKLVLAGGVIVLVLAVLLAVLLGRRGAPAVPRVAPTVAPTATPAPAQPIPTAETIKEIKESTEVGPEAARDVDFTFVSVFSRLMTLKKGEEEIEISVPEKALVERKEFFTTETGERNFRLTPIELTDIKAGELIQTLIIPQADGSFRSGDIVAYSE